MANCTGLRNEGKKKVSNFFGIASEWRNGKLKPLSMNDGKRGGKEKSTSEPRELPRDS
jgi:hypothetical protein